MIILRFLLLLVLPLALCFGPQASQQSRGRHRDQLSYKVSEKSDLFTVISPQVSKDIFKTREPSSSRQQNNNGVISNRHSSSDWLHNVMTIPKSSVLREIRHPVLSLAGWATIVSLIQKTLLWTGRTTSASNMCLSHVAHSFLVSSLGLLLVFRTNSAYQRFLEGRKIWEQIHSISRNISRLTTLYRNEVGSERLLRIKNLIAAFPYLLRHHIRWGCLCHNDPSTIDGKYTLVLEEPLAGIIDSRYEGDKTSRGNYSPPAATKGTRQCFVDRRDMPWNLLDDPKTNTLFGVARATNRPLWLCDRLGQEIMGIPYGPSFTSRERLKMLSIVDKLTNAIGQCERIHQTAVPLNYARHALRSLTLWLFTLPFCLVKDLGLLTGPTTAVIAWLLFGVYQIGHSIEDPFQRSLRLSMLCDAIRRDVLSDISSIGSPNESAFMVEDYENENREFESKTVASMSATIPQDVLPTPLIMKHILQDTNVVVGRESKREAIPEL